jgi:hypothetical protein
MDDSNWIEEAGRLLDFSFGMSPVQPRTATSAEVAEWMMRKLDDGYLYQQMAADQIRENFGEEHVYRNRNGNLAISEAVLVSFRNMSGHGVIWERGQRCWRKREQRDRSGRQQD